MYRIGLNPAKKRVGGSIMKFKKTLWLVALSCSLFVFNGLAQDTVTITFDQGINGYDGLSDAFIDYGDMTDALGEDAIIDIDDGGSPLIGLIRFSNIFGDGPNQIPLGSTINSAVLSLMVVDPGDDPFVHEILPYEEIVGDFVCTTRWVESEVTFENFVSDLFLPQPGLEISEEPILQMDASVGLKELDVTRSLQLWSDGAENLGWIFMPSGSGGVNIPAKEGKASSLTIQTDAGTFNFSQGVNDYDGLKDAWIGFEDFDVPLGQDTVIDIDDGGAPRIGLLRFENVFGNGPNQIPLGTTINSAVVSLVVADPGDDPMLHEILPYEETIGDLVITTHWVEEEVTFENFVSDAFMPQPGLEISEEPILQMDASLGEKELDVTSSFQKWSDGTENLGWCFIPTGSGGVNIPTKEAAGTRTTLTVTYEGVATDVSDFMLHQ